MVKLVSNDITKFNVRNMKYYLHSLMPLSIRNTEVEGLYYVELMADVLSYEGTSYINIAIPFTIDNDKDLEMVKANEFYEPNMNDRQRVVYAKVKKNISISKMSNLNMTIDDIVTGFFKCALVDPHRNEYDLMYVNENMFIRISLFLRGLLKLAHIDFDIFTEPRYDFMIKKSNLTEIPRGTIAIMNGNRVYSVILNRKYIEYSILDAKDYLEMRSHE